MLAAIFADLEEELSRANHELRADGLPAIPSFYIKVLGQTALIEAQLGLDLLATVDVDAFANFGFQAKRLFCEVLGRHGRHFDELSNEIWMPEETEYTLLFACPAFHGFIAKPEYVLLSKLIKAPDKNRLILIEYFAKGPSARFQELCRKYQVNLSGVLRK